MLLDANAKRTRRLTYVLVTAIHTGDQSATLESLVAALLGGLNSNVKKNVGSSKRIANLIGQASSEPDKRESQQEPLKVICKGRAVTMWLLAKNSFPLYCKHSNSAIISRHGMISNCEEILH
ncbi:hypothetical protein Y032_0001g213 [Ancylostoma ceylanicum]|uniref:Uncharacterized protein n=1 Tax=Ancylostoma ceylanicum TaxID=53326 RepID=A0A016W459_9BILA|nr:hypothetical protein Y032_0001g213 [Ancylostoma ceylanicum]